MAHDTDRRYGDGHLYRTVAVAALQGVLGGFIFWFLGLPTPLLWAVVMGLLAIVPVFGTFVVWFPAAIYLALEGSWEKALILTAWGAIVIGCIDNLLYPMLVGNRLKLHTIPAFMSVVGGVVLFGAPGIILYLYRYHYSFFTGALAHKCETARAELIG